MLVCKGDLVGVGVKDWYLFVGLDFGLWCVWLRFVAGCLGFVCWFA